MEAKFDLKVAGNLWFFLPLADVLHAALIEWDNQGHHENGYRIDPAFGFLQHGKYTDGYHRNNVVRVNRRLNPANRKAIATLTSKGNEE